MKFGYTAILVFFVGAGALWAQPANDECGSATLITNVKNYCSRVGEFNNSSATASAQRSPSCFTGNQPNRDVWFSFVAEAENVNITALGDVDFNDGGTLRQPRLAVYTGTCGNLTEIGCETSQGQNFAQIFFDNLVLGQTYYIRVSAQGGNTGTFQLCVNNYNKVPEPSGDCPTAAVLCDKSSFTVDFVGGPGRIRNEITNPECTNPNCSSFDESNTVWYKWTCKDPGTLTFTIRPLNPADDIDFHVYELRNGIDNCNNKDEIRCMTAGANVGQPFTSWRACTGVTGLRDGERDTGETCGCQSSSNNFVAPLQMEAGKSYALVINNFSESGAGFSIQFGGTGTFLGPTADFTTSTPTACVGQPITFTDASSFVGTIENWEWHFGPDADISTATGKGPHTVRYSKAGLKQVLLTVETDRGCFITKVDSVVVECCPDHFATAAGTARNLTCPGADNGAIDLNISTNFPPYSYLWNDSTTTTEDLTNLRPGNYSVTVTDQATCDTVLNFTITGPPPVQFDTALTKPTCGGGMDGAITLTVSGGTPPYQFNWQNQGFQSSNTLTNIGRGDYTVVVRDSNNCDTTLVIVLRELELQLNPAVQAVTPPSCNGGTNGSIRVEVTNGLGPFQYNFNDGRGFQTANTATGLRAGTYRVEVQDQNLCVGSFDFNIEDFPALALAFDSANVSCNGLTDGRARALPSGGVGGYRFAWSNGATQDSISGLADGTYTVTVTDSNQCTITGTVLLTEPAPVFVNVVQTVDVICNGDSTGVITVAGSGGVPPYEFSLDGSLFQAGETFNRVQAGNYTITIEDAEGCLGTTTAVINQPPPLVVDAGLDTTINLGESIDLQAIANSGKVTWEWNPQERLSCTDCPNPTASPVTTTTYQVTARNDDDCDATDEITITVNKVRPVFIPNAFSPNVDGANDRFTLFGGPAAEVITKLRVFDRWGNLLFEGSNLPLGQENLGWDGTFKGKPLGTGVYTYVAEVRFIDGEVLLYEGDITIVR